MIRALYLAECDVCGLLSAIPDQHARALICSAASTGDEREPLVVSRCATITERDTGTETCNGKVLLVGIVAMTQLPSAEQIFQEDNPIT